MAEPVNLRTASQKATKILGKHVVETENETAEARRRVGTQASAPAFYVFNAEDGEGFVLISGEDQMPEVVAYSYTGRFDASNMHPGLVGMLDYYTQVVNDVRNGEATVEKTKHRAAAKVIVAPLCKAEWGQSAPYNTLCPNKNEEECPVGCVATAMAQIMYHFTWPEVGRGTSRYASGISGVGVLISNFSEHYYAWNDMRPTTKENKESEASAAAVAQLSYDCGVATRMKYDPEGSGTNDDLAMAAFYTYFGYKASTLDLLRRECYATQKEWNDLVKAELNANRPVLYGGYSSSGEAGHEFIIDGYDELDNFHVNWGWDGTSNGYYSIVTLNPARTSTSYNKSQSMVCGIEPDATGEDTIPRQWRTYIETAPTIAIEKVELGTNFTVKINRIFNITHYAHTWTIAAALYDLNGNQLQVVTSTSSTGKNTQELRSFYGMETLAATAKLPTDLADGYYSLRAVARQLNYEEFILPDTEGGSELNNIYLQVKDGVAYFLEELPTGVEQVEADVQAVSHTYYDLAGRRIKTAPKGVVLDRQTLSNGKQITRKVFVK